MQDKHFQKGFTSSESPEKTFDFLLDPHNWWLGLFDESIEGCSKELKDVFTFTAGGGLHFSAQQLVEREPGQRIVWLVIESNLSFLKDPGEWTGSHICFDLVPTESGTAVTFTHHGLVPDIACYDSCTDAWSRYIEKIRI